MNKILLLSPPVAWQQFHIPDYANFAANWQFMISQTNRVSRTKNFDQREDVKNIFRRGFWTKNKNISKV